MSVQEVLTGTYPYHVECGDVLDKLKTIPDGCVHCVCTSPPFFGLRDYGCAGQIGLEKTPDEFVAKLVEVFREVRRVLHPSGTLWLNLGDSYCSTDKWGGGGKNTGKQTVAEDGSVPSWTVRNKREHMEGIRMRLRCDLTAEDVAYVLSELAKARTISSATQEGRE